MDNEATQIIGRKLLLSEKIIMEVNGNKMTSVKLAREVGSGYSQVNSLSKKLIDDGVLEYIKNHKNLTSKPMTLTTKGVKIKFLLTQLNRVYNE